MAASSAEPRQRPRRPGDLHRRRSSRRRALRPAVRRRVRGGAPGILADRLADLRLQDPPRPRERPQEQQPPPREQQPAQPAPRTAADAGPEPETEEAPAKLEGAVPSPGCPALPCPAASRGISQARIDRAWRIGKRAGDVLGGGESGSTLMLSRCLPTQRSGPLAGWWRLATRRTPRGSRSTATPTTLRPRWRVSDSCTRATAAASRGRRAWAGTRSSRGSFAAGNMFLLTRLDYHIYCTPATAAMFVVTRLWAGS